MGALEKGTWKRRNILLEEEQVQIEAIKYLQNNTKVINHYSLTKKGKKINCYRSKPYLSSGVKRSGVKV
jgi:hypothetical protein